MFGTKKSESSDPMKSGSQNKPINSDKSPAADVEEPSDSSEEIGALALGGATTPVSPPLKPFKKGSPMSNPPSSSYRPDIPRKVVDIPNPSRLQTERTETSGNDDSNRLVVGRSISLSGDISSCETLVVQGTVEANVTDATTLEVSEGGLFKGDAEVDHAYIAGTFDGTFRARLTLEVAASGHVKGSINYNNISIASGRRVQGTIDVIDAENG